MMYEYDLFVVLGGVTKFPNTAYPAVLERGIFVVSDSENPAFVRERGIFVVLLHENPAFL